VFTIVTKLQKVTLKSSKTLNVILSLLCYEKATMCKKVTYNKNLYVTKIHTEKSLHI